MRQPGNEPSTSALLYYIGECNERACRNRRRIFDSDWSANKKACKVKECTGVYQLFMRVNKLPTKLSPPRSRLSQGLIRKLPRYYKGECSVCKKTRYLVEEDVDQGLKGCVDKSCGGNYIIRLKKK